MLKKLILIFFIVGCSINQDKGFKKISPKHSNIDFSNTLIENDSINILDNEFFYNGAGVALADFNKDSLLDVFFTGNQVDNKLFLNQGNFKFKDVSITSKINKSNSLIWSSGINVIDINNDDLLDIYVCNTLRKDSLLRKNLLYINQGIDSNGIPIFKEMGDLYGISDSTYSSHSQFFDYDNDGDLDLFIGVNRIEGIDPNVFRNIHDRDKTLSVDKLYENIYSKDLKHPVFIDVTEKSKISFHGYSHSTIINDFNSDGYADIYVANDYLSSDLVYINNKDKTFTNRVGEMFKHLSLSSMGSDISDINNDGRLDLFSSEMQPYYNKRKKLFQKGTNYQREILTRKYNYEYQYTRNTLQFNNGINPDTKLPIFSEIGMFSGVHETDWSWASLFADFDNDGFRDLLIVNGFPKDVIDKDFSDFRNTASRLVSKERLLAAIPEIKLPNFIFKNLGDLKFEDYSNKWGMNFPTYTNGAAYGDLDNDGDLDLVFNNINGEATLLENKITIEKENNYVRIELIGANFNKIAYGSEVTVFYNQKLQKHTLISGRGYLSKVEDIIHFGLGDSSRIDSVLVSWPGGKNQIFKDIKINKVNKLEYNSEFLIKNKSIKVLEQYFKNAANESKILYKNNDIDFIDFNIQRTLPHKFSQFGPALCVGDLNGDNLEDILIGGSRGMDEEVYFQLEDGTFINKKINLKSDKNKFQEDCGIALIDIENDGDLDIYISHGSSQYKKGSALYKDVLWINDGAGNFSINNEALPAINSNGSAVKFCDFDLDGDNDLFVGSRVSPSGYPLADKSFLLENISNSKEIKFINSTEKRFNEIDFGMVSDVIWSDFNNDNWPDLIIASEWSSLRFFKNNKGFFSEIKETGIESFTGWWNSLATLDIDNDGDSDYIAGNFGENTYLKASKEEPVSILAKDIDLNGSMDPFISYFLRDSIGVRKNYIYHPMEDVIKQYTGIRKKYNSFGEFGEATMDELFDSEMLKNSINKKATWMKSSWVENLGNEKFKIHPLPIQSQWAPIYGILPFDIDDDPYQDMILVGNDYGVETKQGRADALNGVVLKNNNGKKFEYIDFKKSNLLISKDAKSIVKIVTANDKTLLISSQNNDSLKVFSENKESINKALQWMDGEVKCKIYFDLNNFRLLERNTQNTFQSQSTEKIILNQNVTRVDFFNKSGLQVRSIKI